MKTFGIINIIVIIIIIIIIIFITIIITGKKELPCYFNSYFVHSVLTDMQQRYFETTSVCNLILKQLYRKTVIRPPDIYNVNFKFAYKIQVEKLLHNSFLKICDIWFSTTINSGNIHLHGKWFK